MLDDPGPLVAPAAWGPGGVLGFPEPLVALDPLDSELVGPATTGRSCSV